MLISHYGLLANSAAIARAIRAFAQGVAASHNRFSVSSELIPIKPVDAVTVSAFYRGSGRMDDTSSGDCHTQHRHDSDWQPLVYRGSGRCRNTSQTSIAHCDQSLFAYRGSGRIQSTPHSV